MGEERERAVCVGEEGREGGGFRVFTVHRGRLKYAREVDVSWARELNVSGALELGGAHFLASDRSTLYLVLATDGLTLNMNIYSDRQQIAK